MTTAKFYAFIQERECIRRRRESCHKGPWTDDPILQQFRFTNVKREHDRTTRVVARVLGEQSKKWQSCDMACPTPKACAMDPPFTDGTATFQSFLDHLTKQHNKVRMKLVKHDLTCNQDGTWVCSRNKDIVLQIVA